MWPWPSTYLNKCFERQFYSSMRQLESMHKCRSYGLDKLSLWPFYHLAFKCDLDLQSTLTNVSNGTATPQGEQLCQIIWNSCINVEVMAQTSSTDDNFIISLSSVTSTFNLPEQMFQMALLLLKKNYVKLLWNPCINVEVMTWRSSIYVTFKCDLDIQPTWKMYSNGTAPPQGQQLGKIILKSMAQTSLIYDHFIIWPSSVTLTFNLPEQMFQMALLLLKENNCDKLFWNPCVKVWVMTLIHVTFKCDLNLLPIWKICSNGTAPPQGQQRSLFEQSWYYWSTARRYTSSFRAISPRISFWFQRRF